MEAQKHRGKPPRYGLTGFEQEVLVRIDLERRLRPGQKRRKSYAKIAADLNDDNIPTKKGGKWNLWLVYHFLKRRRQDAVREL